MRKLNVAWIVGALFVAAPVAAQEPPAAEEPPADPPPGAVELEESSEASPPPAPPPVEEVPASDEPPPVAEAAPAAPTTEPAPAAAPPPPPPPPPAAAPPPPNAGGEARSQQGNRASAYGGPAFEGDSNWMFGFEGFFRAPMRIGIGSRENPADGQSGTTFHRPIVPDDQYLSWQYTGRGSDWAEMFFSMGNSWAKGTLGVSGFNFTDSAWNNTDAQFGIAQGYLTITPDLPWKNIRSEIVVGSHWNRYGQAGKYDSGKYDTYMFGRTRLMGYTVRGAIDLPDSDFTIRAEQGFGTHRPNPSVFNNARFTLAHHYHAFFDIGEMVTFGLHYLNQFAREEARAGTIGMPDPDDPGGVAIAPEDQPDGSIDIMGPEVRIETGVAGDIYLAFSRISMTDARTVAPAIEVIHSGGGGEFDLNLTANYLDGGDPLTTSGGNGTINSFAGQYELHLNQLVESLSPMDFTVFLFGMLNSVSSEDPDLDNDPSSDKSNITKLKWGMDGIFDFLPWMGAGFRFDRVQPNSEIPEQSFATINPRLLFRTDFITHELISLGYVRYFYNERGGFSTAADDPNGVFTCGDSLNDPNNILCVQHPTAAVLPSGFGARTDNQEADTRGQPRNFADKQVIYLEASMWW